MSDEFYPPPRTHKTPWAPPPVPAPQRRAKLYIVLSIIFMLLAVAINFLNNTNLVSLKVSSSPVPEGATEVYARLQNRAAMELYVSRHYTLETLTSGEWVPVAANAEDFDPPYFIVGWFGGYELTFGKYGVFSLLVPGQYRLALEVNTVRAFLAPAHQFMLYAEFTVAGGSSDGQ